MSDEKWIVSDKDHLGGKPRVQGTRISVAFLLECFANGMSVAEIVDAYPTLTKNAVQGALHYKSNLGTCMDYNNNPCT